MTASHPALQQGNVAVVTGGASGIGLACARSFSELGLRVCLADANAGGLADAVASIDAAIAVETDVSDRRSVEALARWVYAELGPVSVIMNNAGTGGGGDALSNGEGWSHV
jgi:NAD(P)-dependent dehydrogenase (short-subunit alcohol dehydrogenase family)